MKSDSGIVKPLATNSRPINMQAARLFWKSPWWAKVPIEDKQELLAIKLKIEDLVDVTNPPPKRPGGPLNQIHDARGQKVKSPAGTIVGLVLGYAHSKPGKRRAKKDSLTGRFVGNTWETFEFRRPSGRMQTHYWYVYFYGEVHVVSFDKWKPTGIYEAISVTPENRSSGIKATTNEPPSAIVG